MKRLAVIVAVGLAVALYLWILRPDDEPQGSMADASVTQTDTPRWDKSPTRLLSKAVDPSLSDQPVKVVLDDGPRYPGEGHGRYTRRVKLVQMLKAFIKTAELTKKQEHQVLIALYDLQQNKDAVREDAIGKWTVTEKDWWPIMQSYLDAFYRKLDYILEPWQWHVWTEECVHCIGYAAQGILRLETDDPMPQRGWWWSLREHRGE